MSEPLAHILGPLASETKNIAPAVHSSDARERLRTAPRPQRQPLKSRLGRPNNQNPTSSQASRCVSNLPVASPTTAGNSSTNPAPVLGAGSISILLWKRPDSGA